jgi:hypothetical protein
MPNFINSNMDFLDKVYHIIFRDDDKPEDSDFDLKALKDNLRRIKEKESEKNPISQRNNEKHQKKNEEKSEIIRVIKGVPDPLIAYGRRKSNRIIS